MCVQKAELISIRCKPKRLRKKPSRKPPMQLKLKPTKKRQLKRRLPRMNLRQKMQERSLRPAQKRKPRHLSRRFRANSRKPKPWKRLSNRQKVRMTLTSRTMTIKHVLKKAHAAAAAALLAMPVQLASVVRRKNRMMKLRLSQLSRMNCSLMHQNLPRLPLQITKL